MQDTARKPAWLRAKLPSGPGYNAVRKLVDDHKLHTVCQSAQCPNLGECWSRGTATVMILGNICTRSCNFCAIQTGRPTEYDLGEPARVAEAVAVMNLKHCVITSVARDELKDGGAAVWAATIRAIRHRTPQTAIEELTPEWKGQTELLDLVLDAGPDIFNHNLETVERLQKPVRVQARYDRSRLILRHAKSRGFTTKTGIMLGLGEEPHEIEQTLRDVAVWPRPRHRRGRERRDGALELPRRRAVAEVYRRRAPQHRQRPRARRRRGVSLSRFFIREGTMSVTNA